MIIAGKCVQMLQQPTAVKKCLSRSCPLKTGRAALNLCGLLFSRREKERGGIKRSRNCQSGAFRSGVISFANIDLIHVLCRLMVGLINAAQFPLLQNARFVRYGVSLQLHTLGSKSHWHLCWISPECLDGHLRQHSVKTLRWPFLLLFCLGSLHSAKVGLVCSHVWLGHLLAHTNDPNWESGLHFRVSDRLTGMWGMWPDGTCLLSFSC